MSLRSLPPLAQLRAFAAFVETGTMSKAGVLLNVSHAAISQQIRALEAHLGLSLLEKSGRGVVLTHDGQQLGAQVAQSFGAITREVEALTGADADRPLQISTTPMFAAGWLMPRIGAFRLSHPEIDLMLNPTATKVTLEPGGIDLAIRFGKGHWPGLVTEPLIETDFVIAASASLIKDACPCDPGDLLEFPWLQEIGTTETNDWLKAHGVEAHLVKGTTQVPGNLLLDGLRAGQGIVATTRTFIEADVARGDVVILFEGDDRGHGYFLIHRPEPLRASAKAFATWLKRQARQDTGH